MALCFMFTISVLSLKKTKKKRFYDSIVDHCFFDFRLHQQGNRHISKTQFQAENAIFELTNKHDTFDPIRVKSNLYTTVKKLICWELGCECGGA